MLEEPVGRTREFDYDDVVEKAMLLFWRRGYVATSIGAIESETGLTKGSLYKAFDNKRDLFVKCLERYMVRDSYKAVFIRMFDRPLSETFEYMFDMLIDSSKGSERPCGCLATNVVDELVPIDKDLAEQVSSGLAGMQEAMEFRFRWAQDQGEISSDANIETLASVAMVMLQGMVVLSTSTKDVASMRRARDFLLELLKRS
ncbi:TetR/AcrR family transcriptional regulator [Antarctobacter heliothermus]|uniref:TetR/AcrR family transcriptional regulator n=1 Tax=Antarctobacter heliothermus TaxID=74033 RepID=UPI0012FDA579|nr:TetR/AcrR family transcriptional regulator [Antarctobacter heliothermus]